MNKLTKLLTYSFMLIALPSMAADMKFEAKENITFKGKIATVKTSKKFRNVESCQALCESRNSCAAYTLDSQKGSCTIFKNVSNEVADSNATSGIKK
jgi:hypothetical protein